MAVYAGDWGGYIIRTGDSAEILNLPRIRASTGAVAVSPTFPYSCIQCFRVNLLYYLHVEYGLTKLPWVVLVKVLRFY